MLKDERLREEIREKAFNLIKNGQVMSRGVNDVLKKEYPKASVRDLTIIWAEAREEAKKKIYLKSTDAEKEKFINEIGQEQQEILNKEIATDKENKTVIEQIAEDSKTKSKIEFKESGNIILTVKNKPTLKIKSIEVEGRFGTYKKTDEGVIADETLYKNIEEMTAEKENFTNNIYEQEKSLCKKLEELRKYKIEELEKYAEIEQVFSM